MLMHWQPVAAFLTTHVRSKAESSQERLGQQPKQSGVQIRLPVYNVDDSPDNWFFTTSIGLGTPPTTFLAAIDIGWSDTFVPSVQCLDNSTSTCWPHPLYSASASSTYHSLDRHSFVDHVCFYTSGNVAQESLMLNGVTVPGHVFQETDDLRPLCFWNESWYDVPLGLARRVVDSVYSDLRAASPFQDLVEQGVLRRNVFSLQLPQAAGDIGSLVIGGTDEGEASCHECTAIELPSPRAQSPNANSSFFYTSHHPQLHPKQTHFLSGGWEIQPLSVTFGDISFDLSGYTAALSSMQFFLDLPSAFASPMRDQLNVSMIDGSIDCSARSAGYPDLEFSFKGFGDARHTIAMTPEEYIRKEPVVFFFPPTNECQVPIAMHLDQDDEGEEMPKFIVLGNIFLRKFRTVFDVDRESIAFESL